MKNIMAGHGAIKIILVLLGLLPTAVRRLLFTGLALLFYYLVPRQRLIALHNLRTAFPEKDISEIINIAKGSYRNLGLVAAEFFDLPTITKDRIEQIVEIEGYDHYLRALEKGKGILLFGGHFGNWELSAIAVSLMLKPMMVIYRSLDNPLLDAFVKSVRTSKGNILVQKQKAMLAMNRHLRRNSIVGLLIDQNVDWREGVFVKFFGRPACSTDGLAYLSLETGAPVLPGFMLRKTDGRYRMILGEEVEFVQTENPEADLQVNTQRYQQILEDKIRQYPEQWLWMHHRWKTKPWQAKTYAELHSKG